jgi:hypothetical protein
MSRPRPRMVQQATVLVLALLLVLVVLASLVPLSHATTVTVRWGSIDDFTLFGEGDEEEETTEEETGGKPGDGKDSTTDAPSTELFVKAYCVTKHKGHIRYIRHIPRRHFLIKQCCITKHGRHVCDTGCVPSPNGLVK